MASWLTRSLFGILALAAVMALSNPVSAQNPDNDTVKRVLSIVQNANDEFDRGEYDDALRLYQEAYDLYPDAVLLYRIGLSAERTGDTRRAVKAYEAYVDAAADGDATATKLGTVIPELRAKLPPRVRVATTPGGANVYVDSLESEPIGVTPGEFDLPGNDVELIMRLDGYKVVRRQMTLENGAEEVVEVELQQLKRLASADGPVEQETGEPLNLAIWGWSATGIGVALLATGAAFAIMSSGKTNKVNTYDKRAPGASRDELESLKDSANSLHRTSVATFIAGGVVTGIGGAILLIDMLGRSDDEQAIRPNVGVSSDGAWVGFSGRF